MNKGVQREREKRAGYFVLLSELFSQLLPCVNLNFTTLHNRFVHVRLSEYRETCSKFRNSQHDTFSREG